MLCCIAELCHCTRLPGMGGWEPCTSFTQSIRHSLHHRFPFSCIRCSSCTQMLAIIHDLPLVSHHVVSCHVPGISSRSGHRVLHSFFFPHNAHSRALLSGDICLTQPRSLGIFVFRQGCSGVHATSAQEDRLLVSVHRPHQSSASSDACCWWQDCSKPG